MADGGCVVDGVVSFRGANASNAASLAIASLGVFLAFRHLVEISGVMLAASLMLGC